MAERRPFKPIRTFRTKDYASSTARVLRSIQSRKGEIRVVNGDGPPKPGDIREGKLYTQYLYLHGKRVAIQYKVWIPDKDDPEKGHWSFWNGGHEPLDPEEEGIPDDTQ